MAWRFGFAKSERDRRVLPHPLSELVQIKRRVTSRHDRHLERNGFIDVLPERFADGVCQLLP